MLQTSLGVGGLATSIYGGISASREKKKVEKEQRRKLAGVLLEYDKLINKYKPGGEYGKSLFEEQKKAGEISMGKDTMRAIQSGIAGTTYGGQVAQRYEHTTGRQARMTLEDYLQDKQTSLQREKLGVELGAPMPEAPSYSDISSAYSGVGPSLGLIFDSLKKSKTPSTQIAPDYIKQPSIPKNRQQSLMQAYMSAYA